MLIARPWLRGVRIVGAVIALVALAACGATPQSRNATASPAPSGPGAATAYPAPEAPTAYPAPEAPTAYPAPGEAPSPTDAGLGAAPDLPSGFDPGPIPPDLAAGALADLLQRTGAAPADVRVESAEAVEWSDGSLGCPQPGQMYPQVLTPGYKLVLAAGGRSYNYHASQRGPFFLCDRP